MSFYDIEYFDNFEEKICKSQKIAFHLSRAVIRKFLRSNEYYNTSKKYSREKNWNKNAENL